MVSPSTGREGIIQIGRRLAEKELIAGTDGNISVRLENGHIMITPSGLHKGRLAPDDLVIVDIKGRKVAGQLEPSSEMPMHLFVLRSRPDIQACVHGHPPYATSFAVAGMELDEDILPEVVLCVGRMPLTEYAPAGTEAVAESLTPFIAGNDAFLMANHGLLTIGRSLEEAYNRQEVVEHYARIVHLALQKAELRHLPAEDFERLKALRQKGKESSSR